MPFAIQTDEPQSCRSQTSQKLKSSPLAIHNNSAIGMNRLASDGSAVHTRQEHKASCHLTGLERPANGCCELLLRVLSHGRNDQRRPHRAWCDSIDPDSLTGVLVGKTTSEGDDGALGGCVVKEIRSSNVRVDACIVDDCAARLHVWERVFGEVEDGMDVCVEGLNPLLSISGQYLR
jgi:hypothetical protein